MFEIFCLFTTFVGLIPLMLNYSKPVHRVLLLLPPAILVAIFQLNINQAEGLNAVGLFVLVAIPISAYVLVALIKLIYFLIKKPHTKAND